MPLTTEPSLQPHNFHAKIFFNKGIKKNVNFFCREMWDSSQNENALHVTFHLIESKDCCFFFPFPSVCWIDWVWVLETEPVPCMYFSTELHHPPLYFETGSHWVAQADLNLQCGTHRTQTWSPPEELMASLSSIPGPKS